MKQFFRSHHKNTVTALIGVVAVISLLATPILLNGMAHAVQTPGAGSGGDTDPAGTTCQVSTFFGLTPWYAYMTNELYKSNQPAGDPDPCGVRCFNVLSIPSTSKPNKNVCGQSASDIPLVLLAVVDDLLRIAGLAAIVYVIYGGFRYVSSQGNPEDTAKAQGSIINALVGLAIALIAIVLVSFVGNSLGG